MKKVINNIIYVYKIIKIVLCCAMCYFGNFHNEHKLIDIDNEKILKKEKISIDKSFKDLEENKIKIEKFKCKIQNEMIKIENSYEKINKDVTKTFEAKHEILKKEETEIKDKLENEVNKIKKNLEFNLSKINVLVRNIETLLKTRNTFLEQKDEIMIKKLNYISKISKNQKQMEMLFQQQIKNLRIAYNESERKIKYEEYYFNGIPIPKNIEINDLNSNSFKLIWQIDSENKSNIDIKQIKYKVEIKKENEEFIPAYEGNEPNCDINNLEPLTNYEIRLCSFYNEIMSDWIEIYKIKTKNKIDSSILNNCEK